MLRLPFWEDLPYFHQVAQRGSLRQAANDLRISPATLSRRIRNLEEALGAPLFFRKSNQMELTKLGHIVLDRSTEIERIVHDVKDAVHHEDAPLEIVMTSIPCFATHIVVPRLTAFEEKFGSPINFVINTSPNVSELSQQPFDIAIRLSRPDTGRYRVRRMRDLTLTLAKSPTLEVVQDGPVPLILWGDIESGESRFNGYLRQVYPNGRAAVVVESYQMYVEALRSGLGVGILPEYVIHRNGDGIYAFTCDSVPALPPQELWLVMRSDSVKQDVIRQFSDFLVSISTQESSRPA